MKPIVLENRIYRLELNPENAGILQLTEMLNFTGHLHLSMKKVVFIAET